MKLHLELAQEDRLADCIPVFFDSEIYVRYFQEDGRLERALRGGIEKKELHLAVTETGEIAGAMRVDPRGFCGLYPYLNLIGVRATFRGQHVGGFLMDQLEEMARKAGAKRVTLMVSDFNTDAQAFYKARGYWMLGTLPDASKVGIAELVMVKEL